MAMMRRREFITLIGGAAADLTLPAKAQQAKTPVVGLLSSSTALAERPRRAAFVQRLGELGWPEGRGITIEDRAAGGVAARAGEIAQEFARLRVDVMVMAGDAQVLAAKRTAPEFAIVFAA
ncbi:MAG: hypothetical protein QOH32_710, partial [Bradyrhizobium sp.]|nr:hypothetical protein [Bradyrhizobium sp.]